MRSSAPRPTTPAGSRRERAGSRPGHEWRARAPGMARAGHRYCLAAALPGRLGGRERSGAPAIAVLPAPHGDPGPRAGPRARWIVGSPRRYHHGPGRRGVRAGPGAGRGGGPGHGHLAARSRRPRPPLRRDLSDPERALPAVVLLRARSRRGRAGGDQRHDLVLPGGLYHHDRRPADGPDRAGGGDALRSARARRSSPRSCCPARCRSSSPGCGSGSATPSSW